MISGATQVGACTPLVIDVIGTSFWSNAGPQAGEHLAADLAVQLADAVGALGQPQPHDRHVEDLGVAAGVVLAPRVRIRSIGRPGQALSAAEVLADQIAREPVDAGRDRSVGSEDGARPGRLEGGVEAQSPAPR